MILMIYTPLYITFCHNVTGVLLSTRSPQLQIFYSTPFLRPCLREFFRNLRNIVKTRESAEIVYEIRARIKRSFMIIKRAYIFGSKMYFMRYVLFGSDPYCRIIPWTLKLVVYANYFVGKIGFSPSNFNWKLIISTMQTRTGELFWSSEGLVCLLHFNELSCILS